MWAGVPDHWFITITLIFFCRRIQTIEIWDGIMIFYSPWEYKKILSTCIYWVSNTLIKSCLQLNNRALIRAPNSSLCAKKGVYLCLTFGPVNKAVFISVSLAIIKEFISSKIIFHKIKYKRMVDRIWMGLIASFVDPS